MLLENNALQPPAKCLTFDTNKSIIKECKSFYKPYQSVTRFYHKDLIETIRTNSKLLSNTGVLIYDAYNAARGNSTKRNLSIVTQFALSQKASLGEFLLVINVCLRGVSDLSYYKNLISNLLPNSNLTPKSFTRYQAKHHINPMLITRIPMGF
jgi:hypothetical protein